MTFVKDKMNIQQKKIVGSMDNMSQLIESNYVLLNTKIVTLGNDYDVKVANVYKDIRENYWSSDRARKYIDALVEYEARVAETSLNTIFRS